MKPSISIALATLNGERFLRAQLESLTNQTVRPSEVIVCDDGSHDQTTAILREFARVAPFPVSIFQNKKKLGYRKNFMLAAQKCTGDLISFCDQDDVWHPTKLQQARDAFVTSDILLAFHNARLIDPSGRPSGTIFKEAQAGRIYDRLDVMPWMIIPGFAQTIHRSLLDFTRLHDESVDIFCPEEPMPHDQWFVFLASILGQIAYLSQPLADYRQHGGNASGWLKARRLAYTTHNIVYARYYASAALKGLDNRLQLLCRLRDFASVEDHVIESALEHFRHIQTYAERRAKLYTAKSLPQRARSLASLIKHGAYTHPRARLGLDSLLLDATVGLWGKSLQQQ